MLSTIIAAIWTKILWLLSPDTLLSGVGIAFALGLVIFIHELGHYLACLLLDIRVEEFSIGFGKLLKKWQKGDTQYSLRAIPLGGYVKPSGEFYAREADLSDPRDFAAKPWYARAFMVFAGAGMNYVLAFVIFFLVVLSVGLPVSNPKLIPPVVGEAVAGYPAAAAGMQKGDVIVSINAAPVANWEDLVKNISAAKEQARVEYKRGTEILTTVMPLSKDKKLGLALEPVYEKAGVFTSVKIAAHQCYYWTAISIKTIAEKLWHRQAPDVAGPIGIFEIVGKGVHSGAEDYFFLIGLISVAIGMFNLFPIPILDGGHILFFIIEAIRRKRVKEQTLYRASTVGATFLIALVLYATYSDINRISRRHVKPQVNIAAEAQQTADATAADTAAKAQEGTAK